MHTAASQSALRDISKITVPVHDGALDFTTLSNHDLAAFIAMLLTLLAERRMAHSS